METEIALQLDSLKLLQQWSIWLITISTGLLGLIGYIFKEKLGTKAQNAAKYCIIFTVVTIVIAVMLVGAIPAIVQKLQPVISDNPVIGGTNARGIYGIKYLDFMPLWILVSSQRISFLISIIFGARLLWLRGLAKDN